ncbi:aminotransferase-like domain-containing protein [Balneatrix alpica]|uniref:PLP-dependent aminotransferase family protein n=1 Tax=Balneatrix alpica TaxID=75684 RepID=A0ABV5Z9M8_9GAMM|nr:PLP-dependent aminotransferase family protein [Balneatrix alpica]
MTIWKPDLSAYSGPRYQAIASALADAISLGELNPGTRLPTHRALAEQLGLTVGTITRAYAEAERRGLVEARVGSGTYISSRTHLDPSSPFQIGSQPSHLTELTLNLPVPNDRSPQLQQALADLQRKQLELNPLLAYQPEQGLLQHREIMANWLRRLDWQPDPEQLFITNGGQHGLLLALLSCCEPGDTLACEALTYPGLLGLAQQLHLRLQGLPLDQEGVTVESFAALCKERPPKVLYLTPTLQNPTSRTLSLARRQALIQLCQRHGVWIIEDDVNGWLPVNRPQPLAALAPEQVLHIGSLSKSLAAGLRIGSLVVPPSLRDQARRAMRASCWMASPLGAALACEWLNSPIADELLTRQRQAMQERQALAQQLLGEWQLEGAPQALHAWLPLPEPWLSHSFVEAAAQQGVRVLGRDTFSCGRWPGMHGVRLALSQPPSSAQLEQALQRLRQLLLQGPEAPLPVL